MPRARRDRIISAPPSRVWKLISDPSTMNRWWPQVVRVEAVHDNHFTQVYMSKRGRAVRMDFTIVGDEPPGSDERFAGRRMWEQELNGTPFQRVLTSSVFEVVLEDRGEGTKVTIEHRQKMKGSSKTGGPFVRRVQRRRLDEALDGLQALVS